MRNIFENAKFGDEYKTADGRKAIYVCNVCGKHRLIIEGMINITSVDKDGIYALLVHDNNIVEKVIKENDR